VLALVVGVLVMAPAGAHAQELEPRAYSNAPVGFNFVVVGYSYSQGGLSLDPSLPVDDAKLEIHSALFAYARVFGVCGKSGKLDVVVPYSKLSGRGTVAGEPAERAVRGFSEPRFRLSLNLYGAPALSMKEFGAYRKNLVIGASVQVTAPSGQYDASRAINLGNNRWSIKPDIGFSKAFGPLTLDVTTSATFYTDNDNYFGGKTLEQAPIYAAQAHVSYDFGDAVWASVGTTYYRGGRLTLDGEPSDVELENLRAGAILALPVDRHHSIKLNLSRSLRTGIGTAFSIIGIGWQYRWGAGY
jgi:hypothetical protein